ncbi:MAG: glycosyltransferase family 2 protein [Rhodanobacteraceae bacterium]
MSRAGERVSVVMPVYNAQATLAKAIESVLAQTHADIELLVVDDGSSDGSWAIVEDFARRDPRVRPIGPRTNGGVASARNAALDAATGGYIAFLDSDDWWHAQKLAAQFETLHATGAKVSYSAYRRVDETGRDLSLVQPPDSLRYDDLLKSNYIGHLTGLYRRDIGEFRFLRIGHEDYAFWLAVLRAAGGAVKARHREPLAYYTVRAGSLSSGKLRAACWQWRIYRDVAGLGRLAATRYMMHYVYHALVKRRSG